MFTHYDLHTHSRQSDGTLTPTALVERAAAAGVEVLALTDHDTLSGIDEARSAARAAGIRLIPGVEISVTWNRQTIHVVALNVDPAAPELRAGLERLQEFRVWRAEEIGRQLAKAGIEGATEGARRHAQGVLISRTHFARYLVEIGRAKDLRAVFKKFLIRNKPGHVSGQWAGLEEAVGWIRAAGGQAVIAHPARYRLTGSKLRRLIAEFRDCGGEGLEVVSGSHSQQDMHNMASLARQCGLLASRGSDYHGPENAWIELGRLPALPADLTPVWQAWPQHAA
ncbi:metal-dependent phosphoesterases [Thiohalobacter thiocyanaticus]|uniref:Metal-dependent phosphoesterases n=1 Tax=Thiohalobacter thiocyanaticus TaxID=585455 RepID=A0A1Z4VSH9_9GAMM|nr:PHP domain-containing protein [Thiohalobacter thiocyanaticus]BAZ94586.1 metal-dependent phosphoesterases [Thiohalobacter thiocyanaticus]